MMRVIRCSSWLDCLVGILFFSCARLPIPMQILFSFYVHIKTGLPLSPLPFFALPSFYKPCNTQLSQPNPQAPPSPSPLSLQSSFILTLLDCTACVCVIERKGRHTSASMSPAGSPLSESDMGSSKEQDRFLPIANVSRIMKRSLPANAKISKDAKETVQECISEFISFITGEASDKCQREKRKTINGDDLLWAMTTLGFDSYVSPLKTYLSRYRDNEGEKNTMARQQHPADGADHEKSLSDDGSGSGGGIVNPAVAGVDGGFYSPATTPGFGVGYHGFLGRMGGGVHDEEAIHRGGRASLPSHLHGVHW